MITQEQVDKIGEFVNQQAFLSETVVDQLRKEFSEIHFTYCMDDDVTASSAVAEFPAFNIYLIDSREHCLCFTSDMDIASGVVIAEVEQE